MSHVHIEQLFAVFEEYVEVREAVGQRLRDPSHAGYRPLQRAERNLETTYIVRLFVEFEGILRLVLLTHDPRRRVSREAYNRINRPASFPSLIASVMTCMTRASSATRSCIPAASAPLPSRSARPGAS